MNTRLANAAYHALDSGSHPIAAVLGEFPAVRALYDETTLSPHLLVMNRQRTGIAMSCVMRTAIRCQIEEGSQS